MVEAEEITEAMSKTVEIVLKDPNLIPNVKEYILLVVNLIKLFNYFNLDL